MKTVFFATTKQFKFNSYIFYKSKIYFRLFYFLLLTSKAHLLDFKIWYSHSWTIYFLRLYILYKHSIPVSISIRIWILNFLLFISREDDDLFWQFFPILRWVLISILIFSIVMVKWWFSFCQDYFTTMENLTTIYSYSQENNRFAEGNVLFITLADGK